MWIAFGHSSSNIKQVSVLIYHVWDTAYYQYIIITYLILLHVYYQSKDDKVPFDPAVPLLGLYTKNPETPIQKNLCTPIFIAAQFTIAKCCKQPKCPSVNEWIKKLWYIYTMKYYAAERKTELLPFLTAWMELESIMPSEICQAIQDKHHMISLLTGT